jgi:hypothetical protein
VAYYSQKETTAHISSVVIQDYLKHDIITAFVSKQIIQLPFWQIERSE